MTPEGRRLRLTLDRGSRTPTPTLPGLRPAAGPGSGSQARLAPGPREHALAPVGATGDVIL